MQPLNRTADTSRAVEHSIRTSQLPLAPCRNKHITDALAFINYRVPFYAYLLDQALTVIVVPADNPLIRTAATDGVRLWINEGWAARLAVPQVAFVICHEVEHYMSDDSGKMHHYTQTGTVPSLAKPGTTHPFNQRLLNIALDAIHNGRLVANNFLKMPTNDDGSVMGVLFNGTDPEAPGIINTDTDTYLHAYDMLMSNPPPQPQPQPSPAKGAGAPGEDEGTGAGANAPSDQPDEGEGQSDGGLDVHVVNDLPDAPDSADPVTKLAREQAIGNAAAAAEARSPGSTPLHIKGMLQAFKDDRQVCWTTHLRELMTRAMSGPTKRDWTRLDTRRFQLYGTVCPPTQPKSCKPICFIVDTSGSTKPYRERFITEATGLCAEMLPLNVTIIFIDTRIQLVKDYKPKDFVNEAQSVAGMEWPQGGGTDLDEAFEHLSTLTVPPAAVVTLTDSELVWPTANPLPGAVFLTATTNPDSGHPEWMTTIGITK